RTETPEGINGNDINVSFYPNPVATELTIESDIMLSEIQLYDIMGKRLYTLDADGDATHTVEMGNYAPGTYFVRIISKDGNCTTKKVIKK
ncbi:MAG: T9SS type A sorting domain-containing protein, partial [Bacteroidales bacterium]|nr:T9SS type A sorting domain-containing protein [Bacteroidales bacterium]